MARLTVESIRVFTDMNPKLFALISSLVALAVCAKAEDVVVQKETETKKEHVVSKHPKKKQDVEIQETEKVKKAPRKEQENVEIQKTEVEKEKAPKKETDVEIQKTEVEKEKAPKKRQDVEIQKTEIEKEKAPKKDKDHVTPDKD